jgi:competence protein ComEA
VAIRERLEGLSRAELTGLIVVVALALAAAGLWYARSLPRPIQVATAGEAKVAPAGATGAASASPSAAPVIVDVAGWVRRPGVYTFATGDRIVDAIARAGGARHGADLAALNLAAPLVDGTQILVPRVGAPPAAGGSGSAAGGTGGAGALVNINTASATELEALPGIGEVLAATIVAYRDEHGPFASVDQLEDVSGIGPSTLEDIRDLVTI